jgi:hypothetical protein
MKKLILALVTIALFSCAPRTLNDTTQAVVKTEYTLDECISNSDSVLISNSNYSCAYKAALNSEQILKNQIVIMKELKKLQK